MKYQYVIDTGSRFIDATSLSHAEFLFEIYSRDCKTKVELQRWDEYGAVKTLKTNLK